MTVTFLTSRIPRAAAKRRLAARYASMFHGASGYGRSLRPCDARFSRPVNTICSGGDLDAD